MNIEKDSNDYENKKKLLERQMDGYKHSQVDLTYNPSAIIKNSNEKNEVVNKKAGQNEKGSFDFLNYYCTLDKNCEEIYENCPVDHDKGNNNEMKYELDEGMDIDEEDNKIDKENNYKLKYNRNLNLSKEDIIMQANKKVEIDETIYTTSDKENNKIEDVKMNEDKVKFKKVNKNVKKRISEED